MRTRTRFATVLTLACLASAAAHCGNGSTGFADGSRDGASDARSDAAPTTDARLDGGLMDARPDVAIDVRSDVRDATTVTDTGSDVRPADAVVNRDVPRTEGGGGLTCSDNCTTSDECASRCGAMSGGVFCCSYSASDPSMPGSCYFNAASTCGTPMTGGGDGGADGAGGADADFGDAAGGDAAGLDL